MWQLIDALQNFHGQRGLHRLLAELSFLHGLEVSGAGNAERDRAAARLFLLQVL